MAVNDFPFDSVQTLLRPDDWWIPSKNGTPERGRLLWAFVPIVGLTPRRLVPSRAEATEHSIAKFVLEDLRAAGRPVPALPIAALPLNPGEVHTVYKAKHRPVVVLGVGPSIDAKEFGAGKSWQTNQMLMVAPYFGVAGGETRGGWHPEFMKRIRHAEYPNYVYDRLPDGATEESVMRLDQLQPIGNHHNSYERTDWRLSDAALELVDEQFRWLMTGVLGAGGALEFARGALPKLVPSP